MALPNKHNFRLGLLQNLTLVELNSFGQNQYEFYSMYVYSLNWLGFRSGPLLPNSIYFNELLDALWVSYRDKLRLTYIGN